MAFRKPTMLTKTSDHVRYRDIILTGDNEHPLFTERGGKRISLMGEGGNRRIHVLIEGALIQVPVDLHVYNGYHRAYIAPSEIRLTGKPNEDAVLRLVNQLQVEADKRENDFLWFTEDGLDRVFDFICDEL